MILRALTQHLQLTMLLPAAPLSQIPHSLLCANLVRRLSPIVTHGVHRWAFYVQQLGRGYWAAVARGPPQDAVDAWGAFRATFQNPSPSPSELQVPSWPSRCP